MGRSPKLEGFLEAVGEVYRLIGDAEVAEKETHNARASSNGRDTDNAVVQRAGPGEEESNNHRATGNGGNGEHPVVRWGKKLVEDLIGELEQAQADGTPILPKESVVSDLNSAVPLYKRSVRMYAGRLWDACWAECPSTFGALYLWTTVWYIDVGNIGFHTTPLVPECDPEDWIFAGPDYMTVWRVRWRHLWHTAILCQLVVMLPTIITSFLSVVSIT
jgi:hypothetical protein